MTDQDADDFRKRLDQDPQVRLVDGVSYTFYAPHIQIPNAYLAVRGDSPSTCVVNLTTNRVTEVEIGPNPWAVSGHEISAAMLLSRLRRCIELGQRPDIRKAVTQLLASGLARPNQLVEEILALLNGHDQKGAVDARTRLDAAKGDQFSSLRLRSACAHALGYLLMSTGADS